MSVCLGGTKCSKSCSEIVFHSELVAFGKTKYSAQQGEFAAKVSCGNQQNLEDSPQFH